MYNCYTHGWTHLQKPCPSCFIYTSTDTTSFYNHQALVGVELNRYNDLRRLAEHYEFLLRAAECLYGADKTLEAGLDPMFYHTLTYEGDLELIEKTKQAKRAYEKYIKGY